MRSGLGLGVSHYPAPGGVALPSDLASVSGWWSTRTPYRSSLAIASNVLSQWDNLITAGSPDPHWVQATSGNRPIMNSVTVDGETVPYFDGGARFMTSALSASVDEESWFAVVILTGGQMGVVGSSQDGGRSLTSQGDYGPGLDRTYQDGRSFGGNPFGAGDVSMIGFAYDMATFCKFWANDLTPNTTSHMSSFSDGATSCLGRYKQSTSEYAHQGSICELIHLNDPTPDSATLDDVIFPYLADSYPSLVGVPS